MNAEIICIGTELLLGHIINTNQAVISRMFAELGINVFYHNAVGDNPIRLGKLLQDATKRSDIVITTGGLGPTVDDITLDTVSETFKAPLFLRESLLNDIQKEFSQRKSKMPKENMRQAYLPKKAMVLHNNYGTAPGFILPLDKKKYLICVPGVPFEMQEMLGNIKKFLMGLHASPQQIITKTICLTGIGESTVNGKIKDLLSMSGATTVGIYASPSNVQLKITSRGKIKKSVLNNIAKVESKITKYFKNYIYSTNGESLEKVVSKQLIKTKNTLAIAESCSGGLIANRITNIAGSSKYFLTGIITYSNESKMGLLGVKEETLKQHGAVSAQVARQMVKGIQKRAQSDVALSTTGIAGPTGGSKEKPVGLVYIGCAIHNKVIVRKCFFSGTREQIKWRTSQYALNLLREQLMN